MGVNSCGTTLIDNGTFKNIGAISWDTTAKTAGFTAVAGNGYFVNTTSGEITVTLPSSPSAGDAVAIADYANTADTNKIIIDPNGNNIQGSASNFNLNTEGGTIVLVYVDATQGWLSVDAARASDIVGPLFVTATGGTITTCGDYKLHTFTGPGTFTVSCAGNCSGSNSIAVSVIAGGGGAGADNGAGAGGGGMLAASTVPISVQGYPITVGGGGTGGRTPPGDPSVQQATPGSNSVFSVFTADGGGFGAQPNPASTGGPGGSAGGGTRGTGTAGGSSTESDAPGFPGSAFGNAGGTANPEQSGGGGGAGSAGQNAPGPTVGGDGGLGKDVSPFHAGLSGPNFPNSGVYAGGGSASNSPSNPTSGGAGRGFPYPCAPANNGEPGDANTGGGGGGGGGNPPGRQGGQGGSGIVIISYKYQ